MGQSLDILVIEISTAYQTPIIQLLLTELPCLLHYMFDNNACSLEAVFHTVFQFYCVNIHWEIMECTWVVFEQYLAFGIVFGLLCMLPQCLLFLVYVGIITIPNSVSCWSFIMTVKIFFPCVLLVSFLYKFLLWLNDCESWEIWWCWKFLAEILWVMTPHNWLGKYQRFRAAHCLCFQGLLQNIGTCQQHNTATFWMITHVQLFLVVTGFSLLKHGECCYMPPICSVRICSVDCLIYVPE